MNYIFYVFYTIKNYYLYIFIKFKTTIFILSEAKNLYIKTYFVYISTNYQKTVLYTGITNNLERRIIEHYLNRNQPKTFAGKYQCYYLLHYETFYNIHEAIAREKEIKGWKRFKKEKLISLENPTWFFLNDKIIEQWPPSLDS